MPGQWLSQTHVVEPLARSTYHADGQIRDVEEPYNYTPFKQSKMFAAGVTCSDCHEPHGAKLRVLGRGRLPAMPCSRQIRRREASPSCRHRSAANLHFLPHAGPHLHGRRSAPRSQLSHPAARSFGHARDPERVQRLPSRQVAAMGRCCGRRMVRSRPQGLSDLRCGFPCCAFGPSRCCRAAWHRCRRECTGRCARERAWRTCVARLTRNIGWLAARLPIPIRWCGSARSTCWKTYPPARSGHGSRRCLSDPVRGVRIRAASLLAAVPTASQPPADRARFDHAATEFVDAQRANAERPEARTTLANFLAQRGQARRRRLNTRRRSGSARNMRRPRSIWPTSTGNSAATATAKLCCAPRSRSAARRAATPRAWPGADQAQASRRGARRIPQASELEPGARYPYVYAVALHSGGRRDEAIAVLKDALRSHPGRSRVLRHWSRSAAWRGMRRRRSVTRSDWRSSRRTTKVWRGLSRSFGRRPSLVRNDRSLRSRSFGNPSRRGNSVAERVAL